MEICNHSKEYKNSERTCGEHSIMFRKTIFCVIAGLTSYGKTNLMLELLKREHTLNYSDL